MTAGILGIPITYGATHLQHTGGISIHHENCIVWEVPAREDGDLPEIERRRSMTVSWGRIRPIGPASEDRKAVTVLWQYFFRPRGQQLPFVRRRAPIHSWTRPRLPLVSHCENKTSVFVANCRGRRHTTCETGVGMCPRNLDLFWGNHSDSKVFLRARQLGEGTESREPKEGATPMLILSRKQGEEIFVPKCQLTVTVLDIANRRVRIGISAPRNVAVRRAGLIDRGPRKQSAPEQTR
jgi:carbon storage regulator CsrA